MTDHPAEPRGLTLADLIILVAGSALALALLDDYYNPALMEMAPLHFILTWSAYLAEKVGKLGLAFGLVAWFRSYRYQRPIRAVEFVALAHGFSWANFAAIESQHAWIHLLPQYWQTVGNDPRTAYIPYRLWLGGWTLAGLLAAAGLVSWRGSVKLSNGLTPALLLLAWHGASHSLPASLYLWPMDAQIQSWVHDVASFLGMMTYQLPLAAALLSLPRRGSARWPSISWLCLAIALAAIGLKALPEVGWRLGKQPLSLLWTDPLQWISVYQRLMPPSFALLLGMILIPQIFAPCPKDRRDPPPSLDPTPTTR
jgi:hypothetical protein